jgi:acylphosphatase
MSGVIRQRVTVHGLVQGVFFRQECLDRARAEGVAGWVRNRADGTVEAVFEGEPDRVAAMVAWVHKGPTAAAVTRVDTVDEPPEGLAGFRVRHGW